MSLYRFADPNPVLWNLLALGSAANGNLYFYERGTTTAKQTTADEDGETPNPNPVPLDSDGRANVEVWLDGEYTVELQEEDGTVVWNRDVVPFIAPGLAIPALGDAGYFLTHDGVNLLWQQLRQLPDPTGLGGYYVRANADANGFEMVAPPEAPEAPEGADIVVAADSTIVGDGTSRKRFLTGTATGAVAGTRTQELTVNFPADSFSGTPRVFAQLANAGNLASGLNQPSLKVSARSTSSFTVLAVMGETDDDRSEFDFNAAVTIEFLAIGPCAAEEEEEA